MVFICIPAMHVAIILSGGGNDGLKGAKAIHAAGGLVMVQDPASALVDGMPKSVINYDHPDVVLSPAQLAKNLAGHLDRVAVIKQNLTPPCPAFNQ